MTVDLQVVDGVAVLTLNRPQRRNAIDLATAQRLECIVDEIDAREDVVVSVLAGQGEVFCAGADLKAFRDTGALAVTARRGGFGMLDCPSGKPMIAAVQGAALGGGFELALACDLIVAAEDAVFGLPEVTYGLVPSGGGMLRLPQRIPQALAYRMILTGEPIDVDQAHSAGLVSSVVPADRVVSEALALARVIAHNAPLSVAAAKRVLDRARDWSIEERFARQAAITDPVLASADAAEGARAFAERRPPVWTGT